MITKNRPVNNKGYSTGGVAIVYKCSKIKFKEFRLPGNDFEIVCGIGTLAFHVQKVIALSIYIPPQYSAAESRRCLEFIEDSIIKLKGQFKDPYILIGGDFNKRDIDGALANFPDLSLVSSLPTRDGQNLDRIYVNFRSQVFETGVLKPLENSAGVRSDHSVVYALARLKRIRSFEWIEYTYKKYTKEAEEKFGEWIAQHDWESVYTGKSSSDKALAFDSTCKWAMDKFFPDVTVKRKSTDDPWINDTILDLMEKRSKIFRNSGERTAGWKKLNKHITKLVKKRKRKYYDFHGIAMMDPQQTRKFFKNVRAFKDKERPEIWDVRSMWPGKSDIDIANILAKFFNKISCEFEPLNACPSTYDRVLPTLLPFQVSGRLKAFKKPKSRIGGDLFPSLVNKYHDLLADPLTVIYNAITKTNEWPDSWKIEYVSVIPKCAKPSDIGQLRNISCTLLVSKVYESFLLDWAMDEVALRENQFGGVKGCSTAHYLLNLWQEILSNSDDNRAASVLTAVDFAKAFNRVSHQACLAAFASKGASSQIIRLIGTFLTGRQMTVRVGNSFSDRLLVNGGCPQGSVLGVYLFNVCSDELEDAGEGGAILNDSVETDLALDRFFDERDRSHILRAEAEQSSSDNDSFYDCNSDSTIDSFTDNVPDAVTSTPLPNRTICQQSFEVSVFRLSEEEDDRHFAFTRNAVNRRAPKCIIYSSDSDNNYIPEVAAARWKEKDIKVIKYVDDQTSAEKLDVSNAIKMTVNGRKIGVKRALKSERQFRTIERNAEQIGMKVNNLKTQLLCVSAARSFTPEPYIIDSQGNRIDSCDSMKCLGFHFSNRPTARHHVSCLLDKLRKRVWSLRHLRKSGFKQPELVKVYTAMIRPVAEYCSCVFHTLITEDESKRLDHFESQCLKNIFGRRLSYRAMLKKAEIVSLSTRRMEAFDKFAEKAAASPRFRKWFPTYHSRANNNRNTMLYKEYHAKTDRLYYSPLFVMRRRMNGKINEPIRSRVRIMQ